MLEAQQELLASTKWRQQLRAELVRPIGEESQIARNLETFLGSILELGGKRLGRRVTSGVPRTMAIQKVHLGDGTAIRDERARIR